MGERTPEEQCYDGLSEAILSREPVRALAGYDGGGRQIAAGLSIYRNNVRSALTRVLGDTFPVVRRLVGEDFFGYLAHEYFHSAPPTSPLVSHYGDRLPAFLVAFEPVKPLPYLADVARLERLWLEAYHAAEACPLAPDTLVDLVGEDVGEARFSLHPSLHLLQSPYPVASIWEHNRTVKGNEEKLEPLKLKSGGESILIVRPETEVNVVGTCEAIFHVIKALLDGQTVAGALEAGLSVEPGLDVTVALQTLFANSLIVAVR
jgi:putative DNA-binding protein